MRLPAPRLPALVLGAALALGGGRARAEGHASLELPSPTPWDDPKVLADPARREHFEFVPMFNHRRDRPPWSLRVFASVPEAKQHPEKLPATLLLGDMLFHAPGLLGRRAAFFGLSCASCHPNGGATNDIDVGPQTDRPGNVDMLSSYFTPAADDGIFNPRNVPSLRGARYTAPYGHAGAVGSLGEFVDHVVSAELAEPAMRRDFNGALVFYLEQLDFLPNKNLDALGRLTDKASDAARRGQALFAAPRAQLDGMSCASCHVPASFFTDRQSHLLHHGSENAGPMEGFDTPTLLNTAESAPYFFDGSAPTLVEAVNLIDKRHALGLSREQKSDLAAYLEAVGAVDEGFSLPTAQEQVLHPVAYLNLLLAGPYQDDAQIWSTCLDTVRHELRGAALASREVKSSMEQEIAAFEQFVAQPAHRTPSAANRAALVELRARLLKAAGAGHKSKQAARP